MVPFSPRSGSEACAVWMAPGGRFSGRLIWKDDWLKSGGLSLSSSTEQSTVAVAERGRAPLSRAWTAHENYKRSQDDSAKSKKDEER